MSEKQSVVVSVIKLSYIQINTDLQGDALLKFETAGNADVLLTIPIAAFAEMEAMLNQRELGASQASA